MTTRFREACSQASKACRSCGLLNSWKPGEVGGRRADFPVSTWLRRHTNAHNLTPRFPLPETHFVSTFLNRSWFWVVTIVSSASSFYLNAGWSQIQQWIIHRSLVSSTPGNLGGKTNHPSATSTSHFWLPSTCSPKMKTEPPPALALPFPLNGPSTLKGLNLVVSGSAGKEILAISIKCLTVSMGSLGVPKNIYLSLITRQHPVKHFAYVISFNLLTVCSHFTNEETEAKRS